MSETIITITPGEPMSFRINVEGVVYQLNLTLALSTNGMSLTADAGAVLDTDMGKPITTD